MRMNALQSAVEMWNEYDFTESYQRLTMSMKRAKTARAVACLLAVRNELISYSHELISADLGY